MKKVIVLASAMYFGTEVAPNPKVAQEWVDEGKDVVCIGTRYDEPEGCIRTSLIKKITREMISWRIETMNSFYVVPAPMLRN